MPPIATSPPRARVASQLSRSVTARLRPVPTPAAASSVIPPSTAPATAVLPPPVLPMDVWADEKRLLADGYYVPDPFMLTTEVRDAMPVGREESTGSFPFCPGPTLACYWRQRPRVDIQLSELLAYVVRPGEVKRLRKLAELGTHEKRSEAARAVSVLNSDPRFMITTHIPDCDRLFIRSHHDAAYIKRAFSVIFLAVSAGRALTPMMRLDRYRQLPLPYTSGSEPSSVLKIGQAVRLRYCRALLETKRCDITSRTALVILRPGTREIRSRPSRMRLLTSPGCQRSTLSCGYRGMPFYPFHLWPNFLRRPSWVCATVRGILYALWSGLRSWRVQSSAITRVTRERSE